MISPDTDLNQKSRIVCSIGSKIIRGVKLHVIDEHGWFDTVFIFGDVIEPRVDGYTTASLLVTMVNTSTHFLIGDTVSTRFAKMRYYPVAKHRFQTIRIGICTDVGTAIEFQGGTVFVKLYFRKVIST